jgi:heptosyltransferase II
MGVAATIGQPARNILVRVPNWIGDAVMATPALGALRATFPEATLVVVAQAPVAELFRPHPYCDQVITFDKPLQHRGISGLLRLSEELRGRGFDLAILLQNALEAAVIAWLAKIPQRAGYCTDHRGLLLTHPVPVGEDERRLHHTRYYLNMLASLGVRGEDTRLHLQCNAVERQRAHKLLGNGSWIAINPGATYGSAKRWFPERFAAVADELARRCQARLVLTGSPNEMAIGRDIEQAMQTQPLNLVGKTTVRELMAVLSWCRLLITNDSGPMHVAAALEVPVVAIFGPTDHTTTGPLTPAGRIVRHATSCAPCLKRRCPTDHRCMRLVTVAEVLAAAMELLEDRC